MSRLAMTAQLTWRYSRSNAIFPYAIFFREFSQDRGTSARCVNIIALRSLYCFSLAFVSRRLTVITTLARVNRNECPFDIRFIGERFKLLPDLYNCAYSSHSKYFYSQSTDVYAIVS